MSHPNKKRLRRSMMFLNCQKPGLIKDPYIYRPDSIMLDLEDAVAENQKDAARYSLYHALQEIDYRGVERVVRIYGYLSITGLQRACHSSFLNFHFLPPFVQRQVMPESAEKNDLRHFN